MTKLTEKYKETLKKETEELLDRQYTMFGDFLNECRVRDLSIGEACEIWDKRIMPQLPILKKTLGDSKILGDKARKQGQIDIDISGLSPEGQRIMLKAFSEEEKESKRRRKEKAQSST